MRALRALVFALALLLPFVVSPVLAADKVGVCHDADGKYVYVSVDDHALKGHAHHERDVFDISKEDCLALNEAA
jgi:hypothetical protein